MLYRSVVESQTWTQQVIRQKEVVLNSYKPN